MIQTPTVCAYEHCQKPIETLHGHRRKEYCNDVCRQAAHRLRKERERTQREQVVISTRPALTAITVIQAYLHTHQGASIPVPRGRTTLQITALRDDGVGSAIGQGILALSDEDLEQMCLWMRAKTDILLPHGDGLRTHQVLHQQIAELELQLTEARTETRAAQRALSKYLPAPRGLLECTLRHWSTKTTLLFQDKALAGDDLDTFIRESSDHRLQHYIASAEGCYFIGKHHQRRIAAVADAIKQGVVLLYHGDSTQALTGIDAQGYVTLVNGGRAWLSIDDVQQFWTLIVVGMGQHHVGSNVEVAYLQQYLCDYPGDTIPVRRGTYEYQIVFLDDDALAVAANQRSFKLYADELAQAHVWINTKRDEKSA